MALKEAGLFLLVASGIGFAGGTYMQSQHSDAKAFERATQRAPTVAAETVNRYYAEEKRNSAGPLETASNIKFASGIGGVLSIALIIAGANQRRPE